MALKGGAGLEGRGHKKLITLSRHISEGGDMTPEEEEEEKEEAGVRWGWG